MTVGIGNEVVSDDEEGLLQDVTVIGAGSELLPLQSGMRKRGLIRFHRALGWKAVKS